MSYNESQENYSLWKGVILMKRWLLVGVVVLVLVGGAVFFLAASLDTLITKGVEHFGSEITQTQVSLDKTEISASSGKGALKGLKVGNPKNFHTASAFQFNEVSLALDVTTLTAPTIVIHEIVIAAPEITYELGDGGSNMDAIKRNIDSYLKSAGVGSSGGGGEEKKADSGGKKLIIEKFSVRGGKVNVSAAILKGKSMTVSLPAIELRDIGKDKGGASPGEVADKMFDALSQGIGKVVKPLNLDKAQELVEGVAGALSEGLGEGVGDSKEALDKGLESVGDSVKGLFGK